MNFTNTISTAVIPALILVFTVLLQPVFAKQADPAIQGYDVVSYFTDNKARAGSTDYSYSHKGKTWWFSSAKNRQIFTKAPENYLPQYDGFCAYGVMYGQKIEASPEAWAIIDGKLYLNTDKDFQKKWQADTAASIQSGDEQWTLMQD